eukprot:4877885-Prymnesium_polylepis.1
MAQVEELDAAVLEEVSRRSPRDPRADGRSGAFPIDGSGAFPIDRSGAFLIDGSGAFLGPVPHASYTGGAE